MTNPTESGAGAGAVESRKRNPWLLILATVLMVLSAALVAAGAPVWVSATVAAVPWFIVLQRTHSRALAAPFVMIGLLWAALIWLIVTAALSLDILNSISLVCVLVGLGGIWILFRSPSNGVRRRRGSLATWAPALVGPVVWLLAALYSLGLPRGERLGWVLANDTANNLIFARETLYRGGTAVGVLENPVPLPSTVFALAIAPGRASSPPESLLEHDIAAFALVWVLLIALTCFMAGVLTSTIVKQIIRRPMLVVLAGVAGSVIPLTWVYSGYPMEYGFFNTHLALPILIAAFALYLHANRSLGLALTGLLLDATLILAVWSPLVVIPVALMAVLIVVRRRELMSLRGMNLIAVACGVVQLIAFSLLVVLPAFLSQRGALAGVGGIYRLPEWVVFVSGAAVLACGWTLYRRLTDHRMLGLVAVVTSGWAGLAALLFISRRAEDPWTYYPLKFSWLLTLLFLLLLFALLLSLAGQARRLSARVLGLATIGALVVGLFAWMPSGTAGYTPMGPVERILGLRGAHADAAAVERVFELANPEAPAVLWESELDEDAEGFVNVWLTLLRADSMTKNADLRLLGLIAFTDKRTEVLCQLGELMGPGLEVRTINSRLPARIAEVCPAAIGSVVVEKAERSQ